MEYHKHKAHNNKMLHGFEWLWIEISELLVASLSASCLWFCGRDMIYISLYTGTDGLIAQFGKFKYWTLSQFAAGTGLIQHPLVTFEDPTNT